MCAYKQAERKRAMCMEMRIWDGIFETGKEELYGVESVGEK